LAIVISQAFAAQRKVPRRLPRSPGGMSYALDMGAVPLLPPAPGRYCADSSSVWVWEFQVRNLPRPWLFLSV